MTPGNHANRRMALIDQTIYCTLTVIAQLTVTSESADIMLE